MLQRITNDLNTETNSASGELASLSNLINAVAIQTSLLKQEGDITLSQLVTASRRSTSYVEMSSLALFTAQQANELAVKISKDAVFMLNVVQNFQLASSDAAAAAAKALLMVAAGCFLFPSSIE